MRTISQLLIISFLWLLGACISYTQSVSERNVASIYNPASSRLHPQFVVNHKSDTISELLVKFFPRELLFNKPTPTSTSKARLQIKYFLFKSFDKSLLVDSGSFLIVLENTDINNEYISYLPIKALTGDEYSLEIVTTDLHRSQSNLAYITVDKRTANTQQSFLMYLTNDSFPLFRRYFMPDESFTLQATATKPDSIFISYFSNKSSMPAPPFSTNTAPPNEFIADSTKAMAYHNNLIFTQKQGVITNYSLVRNNLEGATTYGFNQYFPNIKTVDQLLEPLKYLTSSKEYKRMETSPSKKIAIDEFWLKTAGNIDRGKELIRAYYNRVLFSNVYFTSHIEGWRSDRGMIYIIFGPPETIYKTDDSERWIYGENRSLRPLIFVFKKTNDPFSENHYVLKRNTIYKPYWYKAADTWRNGRVYVFESQ